MHWKKKKMYSSLAGGKFIQNPKYKNNCYVMKFSHLKPGQLHLGMVSIY